MVVFRDFSGKILNIISFFFKLWVLTGTGCVCYFFKKIISFVPFVIDRCQIIVFAFSKKFIAKKLRYIYNLSNKIILYGPWSSFASNKIKGKDVCNWQWDVQLSKAMVKKI